MSTVTAEPSGTLTPRQVAILSMIGDGLGLREIAARLCLSPWTVRNTRDAARQALGARTTTHAVAIVVSGKCQVSGGR